MNARELHDKLSRSGANPDLAEFCAGHATILSALDLLAAVEDRTDEIVRELRGQHCRDFGSDPQCDADGLCICAMHERAAAALVAMRAAKEKTEAERDALYIALQHQIKSCSNGAVHVTARAALDTYHAAHPKEGA